ncbi:ATP-binding protein [Kaarinaea lacus]
MSHTRNTLSDDWKRNWQQSIAVRISALALWVVLPLSLFITFYFISGMEVTLEKQYAEKADTLAYRLQSTFENSIAFNDKKSRVLIESLLEELGFSFIRILTPQEEIIFGKDNPETQFVTRTIKIPVADKNNNQTSTYYPVQIVAYHPVISKLVTYQRNSILYPVIIGLILFGLFLMWAIRTTVHKPLENLIDATQAVSQGDHQLRLDTNRQDEFGYIAEFFNEMLDRLLEQQEQLKYAVTEAKKANNAKSAFLANMSHELRTPLNAIIGYSDLLVEQATDLHQLECIPDLHKISTAGKYLLDLINNILDITKIETGKTEVYYERIDACTMIDEITSTMLPLVDKKENELIVDIDSDIGEFKSDYTKLRQSLFNLLSNACKFTRKGKISLRVHKIRHNNKEKILFEIADTGSGMSEECLKNLFVPFSRGKNSQSEKISGTGLGLAISRHFCNLLDGEISVQSTLGAGTVFTIHIPYIKSELNLNRIPLSSSAQQVSTYLK